MIASEASILPLRVKLWRVDAKISNKTTETPIRSAETCQCRPLSFAFLSFFKKEVVSDSDIFHTLITITFSLASLSASLML